jgi:hypothetical protein
VGRACWPALPRIRWQPDVGTGKPECAGKRVDHGRWIAAPVLVVEVGHLASETQVHDSSLPAWRLSVGAVERTA